MQFFRDVSLSTIVAGLVAVLVGFTSSIALVFQAAQSFSASSAHITSWVWALCMGVGLCCIVPSLWLRQPVMVAWSTPGAAVLAAGGAAGQFGLEQAVGAFIGSAVLILLCGVTGIFERLMTRIPVALASALLAGVLAKFGMDAFGAAATGPAIVLPMLAAYILGKHYHPRYVVLWTLVAGIAAAALQGQLHWEQVQWTLATPQWTTPVFTWQAFVSLGLPLFVVTMASQNLPGVIVMRSAGYAVPVSGIVSLTGALSAVLAPFGGYAINFAAITAALCTGTEAHPDPARRYTAAVVCGVAYLILGGVCRCGHRLAVGFSERIGAGHRRVCLAGQYCRWLARCLGRCPAAGSRHRDFFGHLKRCDAVGRRLSVLGGGSRCSGFAGAKAPPMEQDLTHGLLCNCFLLPIHWPASTPKKTPLSP